jgi:hypothetical protein
MRNKQRHEEVEFRILIIVTWPAFFLAELLKRLMPWNWGRDKRSVFEATRIAAYSTIPYAFM